MPLGTGRARASIAPNLGVMGFRTGVERPEEDEAEEEEEPEDDPRRVNLNRAIVVVVGR